jgi:uncharacterized membrane protein
MSDDPIAEAERGVALLMADDHPAASAAEAYAPAAPHTQDAHAPEPHVAEAHGPEILAEPHHAETVAADEGHHEEAPAMEASSGDAVDSEPAPEAHAVEASVAETHADHDHGAADDHAAADAESATPVLHEAVVEPAEESHAHAPHEDHAHPAEAEAAVESAPAAVDPHVHAAEEPAGEHPAGGGHGKLEALAAAAVVGGIVAAADHVMNRPTANEASNSHPAEPMSAETTRPTMSQSSALDPDAGRVIDPMLASFDHIVALAGYALLFASVFMLGVPALASVALAYAHHNDAHMVARTHFRFQIRIFWTAVLLLALGVGAGVIAGGVAIGKLIGFIQDHLPGISDMMAQAHVGALSGAATASLVVGAIGLFALAAIWTLFASIFGFLRLLSNRPIGHMPRAS